MDARNRTKLFAALIAGSALIAAGCDRTPTERSASQDGTTPPAITSKAPAESSDRTIVARADDAALTGKVKAAVAAEPEIRSMKIDVDTKNGVVTLNGTVASQEQKMRAKQAAQNVDGVKQVVDNLTVSTS
jgi:hypothetical protein